MSGRSVPVPAFLCPPLGGASLIPISVREGSSRAGRHGRLPLPRKSAGPSVEGCLYPPHRRAFIRYVSRRVAFVFIACACPGTFRGRQRRAPVIGCDVLWLCHCHSSFDVVSGLAPPMALLRVGSECLERKVRKGPLLMYILYIVTACSACARYEPERDTTRNVPDESPPMRRVQAALH